MKIAHILPHSAAFPLENHNGRYEWVRQLALLQAKQGHSVTIYGSPDSVVSGVATAGISNASDDRENNNKETFRLAFSQDHDIYHSHFDDLHYEVSSETSKPIVYTQHWWPTQQTIELAKSTKASNVWAVPPTNYMHSFDVSSGIQTKGHIHHGINLDIFKKSNAQNSERFLFVGRISPEKNLDLALSAIKKAGAQLDIVGKVAAKNQQYWQKLQQYIDGDNIRYLGQKNQTELVDLYSAARGVLCPFEATEAFGLVVIEAQACGAPVIAKKGGSRNELLQEGKTGLLYDTEEEFVTAILNTATLKSDDCIQFAKNFDIVSMAKAYEQLYESLI